MAAEKLIGIIQQVQKVILPQFKNNHYEHCLV